ncbi:MAG: hypothetical protein WA071_11640 [Undibacterium umbellatum]|uniref:hypothetical protein n=1 Tax=Undibacterium umbellatum TaxID=2762300 RepID=UPI003BB4C4BC
MSEVSMTGMESVPDSLVEMLPVGMIAGGGMAAAAMAIVANRKFLSSQPVEQQYSDWQAFHYERISVTEFEITGGIADASSSGRKFHGNHDTVVISEAEILAEMHLLLPQTIPDPARPASQSTAQTATASSATSADASVLKVLFTLPDDELGRQRILRAFHLQADFFGAKVQACSLHDASLLKLD